MCHSRICLIAVFGALASTAWPQTISSFDAPGSMVTFPQQITKHNTVVGSYFDGSGINHGFIFNPDGSFVIIDALGEGTGPDRGTHALGINQAGTAVVYYLDPNTVLHASRAATAAASLPLTRQPRALLLGKTRRRWRSTYRG